MMNLEEVLKIDLWKILDLTDAPAEDQTEFIREAAQRIMIRITKRIEQNLASEQQKRFMELFDNPAPQEERITFLAEHVPNFADVLIEETIKFKKELVEAAEKENPHSPLKTGSR